MQSRSTLTEKIIKINSIDIKDPSFAIYNYLGNRPAPADISGKKILIAMVNDPNHLRWNADGWDLSINELNITNGAFKAMLKPKGNLTHRLTGNISFFPGSMAASNNLRFQQDSLTAIVSLTTKERSGFEVKKLTAKVRMHPEAMEFSNLDLRTNRSHLHNFFAMRYSSFNDMSEFISKVRMEGNFNDAELNSDDIAYFAPSCKILEKENPLEWSG